MPYRIRKRPNHPNQAKVYRLPEGKAKSTRKGGVYAQDGKPLSNKWLTVKQAEKQKIAVQIAEAKKR